MDRQFEEQLKRVWAWLHSKDLYTWIGHGVVGFLLTWLAGWQFTFGAFVYREVSDLINAVAELGWRQALQTKGKDGFFDLWAPLAGAALAMVLFG